MKTKIYTIDGQAAGEIDLPSQFDEEIRPDLIKRAVLSVLSNNAQRKGNFLEAGKRSSAYVSKRRRKYRGIYGRGASRSPRKVMSRSGTQFNFVGAFTPFSRGGRRAHPTKAEKNPELKVNKKERQKAIRSAIAATGHIEMIKARGHISEIAPIIVEDKAESLKKTKDIQKMLISFKLEKELERSQEKSIRAGRGKSRDRPYKKKKGLLIVVSKKCEMHQAAKNIPGVDIVCVNDLNANLLAPGTLPGRLTIYTKSAIELMKKEGLFER
jgi:large subunit ribosomal protein L4e